MKLVCPEGTGTEGWRQHCLMSVGPLGASGEREKSRGSLGGRKCATQKLAAWFPAPAQDGAGRQDSEFHTCLVLSYPKRW